MKPIKIINGPNLNLLGLREPHVYGSATLSDIEALCTEIASDLGVDFEFHQSNHEGVIIDLIQEARERCSGIILNPAGFTSTSIAILDALLASDLPIIEVHITNIHRREEWRHLSYVSKAATAIIAGAGPQGYELALRHMSALVARS
ncbi:type II 3-dehydroquinate dehydratase [Salinibacterium sp. SYSU T00001]|uniref:type II 3-dehydroquinate dehydratase n=1 Tax=Homoserinimonas sedimenticola TaxID=2986805 RepID=UPI002236BE1D|nr:type II 3-dehydroquinate dehydratase [Salinibacterium sedimenticola]MCW4385482.1 type II 3-dehydroquinate dehydratase [Salinibacterium sedimenticola]